MEKKIHYIMTRGNLTEKEWKNLRHFKTTKENHAKNKYGTSGQEWIIRQKMEKYDTLFFL
jgi:hypothetical protein